MLGLKLTHVNKTGPRRIDMLQDLVIILNHMVLLELT